MGASNLGLVWEATYRDSTWQKRTLPNGEYCKKLVYLSPKATALPQLSQQCKSATRLTARVAQVAPTTLEEEWTQNTELHEYTQAANPDMPPVPITVWPAHLHEEGPSRVVPLTLEQDLGTGIDASSPNLAASYVRVCSGDWLETRANATSHAFAVIRGSGSTTSEYGTVRWKTGDAFSLPATTQLVSHMADQDLDNGAALYWINDSPLLDYLGVTPTTPKFKPAFYKKEDLKAKVQEVWDDPEAAKKNRIGTLLGNKATSSNTKTMTHILWGLYNVLPAGSVQKPHRHAACALDLCTEGPTKGCYTLMGPDLDEEGNVKDGVKVPWAPGAAFSTPPGWWHSHHNETEEDAWVLPMQDAGLYTYQRTLDIRFAAAEVANLKRHQVHGASVGGSNVKL